MGSLGEPGELTHAATFFAGLDVHVLDYSDAARSFEAGGDAVAAPSPMQPSYEDRVDVPDRVLASVSPELAGHLSAAWEAPLRAAAADQADVFHLHHLTPQFDAARRHWSNVALVAHLHGTEMKLIEAIRERVAIAVKFGETLETMPAAAGQFETGARLDPVELEMLHNALALVASRRVLGRTAHPPGTDGRPHHHGVSSEPRRCHLPVRDRTSRRHRHRERRRP